MSKPKAIFLDAVGTLFGVKGSVGEVYGSIAKDFGVEVSTQALNQAFFDSFKASTPLAFPDAELLEIPEKEYYWWEAIARDSFTRIGAIDQFTDFASFFDKLYGYFATPNAWVIYPDILPSLEKWRRDKIELGIISNFDSRLYALLETLGLKIFFKSVTISPKAGAAKPDPKIFQVALEKHQCEPREAWHIGDSLEADYNGAKAAGLRPFLLKRS